MLDCAFRKLIRAREAANEIKTSCSVLSVLFHTVPHHNSLTHFLSQKVLMEHLLNIIFHLHLNNTQLSLLYLSIFLVLIFHSFVRTNLLLLFTLCLLWWNYLTCEWIVGFRRQSNDNDYCIPFAYQISVRLPIPMPSYVIFVNFNIHGVFHINWMLISLYEWSQHNLHWNESKCLRSTFGSLFSGRKRFF